MTATDIARVHPGPPAAALREQTAADPSQGWAPPALLAPIATPDQILAAQDQARATIAKALKAGRDYGVIEGTERPTLLMPGALRLCAAYALVPRYTILEQEIDHDRVVRWKKWRWGQKRGEKVWTEGDSVGLYRVVMECSLISRASGDVVASSVGVCSTLEAKYIDRPRDLEHTVVRMATKRALVGAVIAALGLAGEFDLEESVEESETERLAGALRDVINELSGLDAELAAAAHEQLEELVARGGTAAEIKDLGTRTLAVVKKLRKSAGEAA